MRENDPGLTFGVGNARDKTSSSSKFWKHFLSAFCPLHSANLANHFVPIHQREKKRPSAKRALEKKKLVSSVSGEEGKEIFEIMRQAHFDRVLLAGR